MSPARDSAGNLMTIAPSPKQIEGAFKVARDEIEAGHFRGWTAWAKSRGVGLDFNPTCSAHAKAADGFTLSHPDRAVRRFWIEHCRRAREIGAAMGKALGTPCVTNIWVPDGFKDTPADRLAPRARLAESLDAVFEKPLPPKHNLDAGHYHPTETISDKTRGAPSPPRSPAKSGSRSTTRSRRSPAAGS